MDNQIAVIAHQKRHFDQWVHEWVANEDKQKFVLVTNPDDVRGRKFSHVISIGPYWHIKEYEYLRDLTQTRVMQLHTTDR